MFNGIKIFLFSFIQQLFSYIDMYNYIYIYELYIITHDFVYTIIYNFIYMIVYICTHNIRARAHIYNIHLFLDSYPFTIYIFTVFV